MAARQALEQRSAGFLGESLQSQLDAPVGVVLGDATAKPPPLRRGVGPEGADKEQRHPLREL